MQATLNDPAAPATLRASPPPSRRRARRRWLLVLVVLVVVGGVAAAVLSRQRGERGVPVTLANAEVRTITQLVSATGRVQPVTEVKISAEVSGEIVELPVRSGQSVKRGDLLVRINPDLIRRAVEQQEATLLAAEAQLEQAEAILRQRELDFRDAERLFASRVRSESDLRAAQAAFESAGATVKAAAADILRAKASLDQSRENLSKTTIVAPMDGTVSVLNAELGDRVVATGQFAGTEIMRVADLGSMEVRVNVNENDVVNVKVGDTARITVDAFRDQTFQGRVREIASTARTTGVGTQDEVTNFEVRINIAPADGAALRPGMSASADIETRSVANALAVPIQSVTVRTREADKTPEEVAKEREQEARRNRGDGAATAVNAAEQRRQDRVDRDNLRRVVFVVRDGKAKLQPVETGIQDNTHMEIRSGLEAGDRVVAGPWSAITRTLKDGSAVTEEKPRSERRSQAASNP